MKIFSLTDVETPLLKQHGLVGKTLAVGSSLLPPGASVEIEAQPHLLKTLSHFVSIGALAVDTLPPGYVVLKDKMSKAEAPKLEAPKKSAKKDEEKK